MKQNIVVLFWSISVLAALFIGQALNDPVSFTETSEDQIFKPSNQQVQEVVEKSDETVEVSEKKSRDFSQRKSVSIKTPASVDSVIVDLVNHFEKSNYYNFDNYRNMADTWDKLKDLNEEQLLEVYEQLKAESEKGVNWNISRILYARLGEIDPGKAIEHALENKETNAINGVITAWAKENPLEALEWIQNNKESFPKSNRIDYYGLFSNLAKVDLNKALQGLKGFDTAKQRNAFNGIARTAETNEDFMNILSKVGEYSDSSNKVGTALYYWSQKSPLDAIAWAETMPEEKEKRSALRKIESSWLRKSPVEAADWIMSKNDDKKTAVSTIVNGWDWKDGDNLYKWIQGNSDGEARDNANYSILRRYSHNNSDLARKALENIESETVRKKAVTQLYRTMRYRNREAAEEFLKGRDEVPEEEKEKLLSMQIRR